ncbi:hypothetical protein Tco_0704299 [Tanacetum coccineum]|uniref:Uncharacterized protein n=1 Tax=Tanacetum coccineum TaxID=301880 RepID=A0ABQ4Y191_9ASTR
MTGLPGDSKGQTETEVSKNSKGCLPKTNISLSASLPMQRSQVILLKNQACNKIRSSSRETMMNNPLTRRLPKSTGSKNPSDLQLLILVEKYGSKNRVLAGFGIGGKAGERVYTSWVVTERGKRSMVIQKRVEDLQLGVESYQKKINVTKAKTTRPGLGKKDPYTPYQDPQIFIYFDNQGRNRLMRSDELYKFSDGTLTRL